MNKRINNYSEYVICEILNSELMYGNLLYEKAINYIDVQRITIYKILERLSAKETIEVISSDEKKKFYRLTKKGKESLDEVRQIYPRINLNEYVTIGSNFIKLDTIDSTSSFIKMNKDGLNDGDVVIANKQLAPISSSMPFESSSDTLELSFLMKPNYEIEKSFYITQVIVASLIKTFEKLGVSAELRWPHDIYVSDKLIGSFEIEGSINNLTVDMIVVGLAIYLNNEELLDDKASSFYMIEGVKTDFADFSKIYFEYFNKFHQDLIINKFGNFIKVFKNNCKFVGNTFERNGNQFKVLDLTERGNLVIVNDEKVDLMLFGELDIAEYNS